MCWGKGCSTFGLSRQTEATPTHTHLFTLSTHQTRVFDQLTLQCVVETGRPMFEATTTVRAEASSMLKPLQWKKENMYVCEQVWRNHVWRGCGLMTQSTNRSLYLEGVMGVRSLPMVWITLRPHTQRPAQIPTPPYSRSQMGVAIFEFTLLVS